jgi:hypothetical protein
MTRSLARLFTIGIAAILVATACLPKATPSPATLETAVAQAAFDLLTQTASAASPTPPPPTVTPTPISTDTPTSEPTSAEPPRLPQTITYASCGLGGPEPEYTHETSVKKGKGVELLGVGSLPGYVVIRDPYFHRPCWMAMADLKIFPGTDLGTYPVMTPGVPLAGH